MPVTIVIYETREAAGGFGPLARLRPVYDLTVGVRSFYERAASFFSSAPMETVPRAELAPFEARRGRVLFPSAAPRAGHDVLLLSGDIVVTAEIARAVLEAPRGALFQHDRSTVGAKLTGSAARELLRAGGGEIEPRSLEAAASGTPVALAGRRFQTAWGLVEANGAEIEREWEEIAAGMPAAGSSLVDARAALLEPERIRIEEGASVDALAVLDARSGPILIREGARIAPLSRIIGPCVIGRGTQVLGGKVGGGSTVGPVCRVNGEVEASILLGYSNKAHDGFLGHSVLGEWANLGALTTSSDLKNNYGPVRVAFGGREVDTGLSKVGVFLGDHVKTGIGSLLPTGGAVDVGCNLFGGGTFAPRWVPAFTWWDGSTMREHRFDGFLATARRAMARRDVAWDLSVETLLRLRFEETAVARAEAGVAVEGMTREKARSRI